MNQRAKTSAFVLGLIGGILNAIFSIFVLIALIQIFDIADYYDVTGYIFLFIGLFIVSIMNLIGGCICRNRRTAGGVLMLISGGLLFIYLIYAMAIGGADAVSMIEGGMAVILAWFIAQLLSITGATLCFTGAGAPKAYMPRYGQPYGQYQQPYGPYQQPYGPYQQPYGQPQPPYGQQPNQQPQQPPQEQSPQPKKTEE